MNSFFKRIGLSACVLATGLAQAQPPQNTELKPHPPGKPGSDEAWSGHVFGVRRAKG